MEHKGLTWLAWGLVLALVAHPLYLINEVPFPFLFPLAALGYGLMVAGLGRLSSLHGHFEFARMFAGGNGVLALMLACGGWGREDFPRRLDFLRRPGLRVTRHDWFPLDQVHYIVLAIVIAFVCAGILEWARSRSEPLEELAVAAMRRRNSFLLYFAIYCLVFSLGLLAPRLLRIGRWLLVAYGCGMIYLLYDLVARVRSHFERDEGYYG